MMVDGSKLSYEDACRIAGVPEERGYVTLREVVNAINEKLGIELVASDQIGYVPFPKRHVCYTVTIYHETMCDEGPDDESIYGIYSSEEKAKAAAKAYEQECLYTEHDRHYNGYSITEWEMDADNGALRDV